MHFDGLATSHVERAFTPAQASLTAPVTESTKVAGDPGSKQALYRLLGQDLDICVEAHADAYEQSRKKWSECSVEEWTKGADGMFLISHYGHLTYRWGRQLWPRSLDRC